MAGGRIPESFIHDLLARVDIVELIGSRIELKRSGKEYKANSPFSNEKTPSFFVSPVKQMFFDFSSGKNGNAVGFLMEFDRLSFVEAVEELARRAGVEVPREGGQGPDRLVLEGPLDALAAAQRWFREQLRSAQPAIDYLKKRGVNSETAKTYGIGYAPESFDALTKFFDQPEHALAAGLLKKKEETGRVYDGFRNRIMFPIRDTRGRVIGFGGRAMGDEKPKYLNSPETPLFHKGRNLYGLYEAKQSSKANLPYLIVVEGYMDVVMLAQYGISEAVATLGTATTRDHLNLLFKSTGKVVFCFDGDRAGRSAAWRALEQALPEVYEQRECGFVFLPEGHDPDTLVQEIGADEFRKRLDAAMPLSQFLLGELAKQVNLGTLDGRAKLAGLARPHVLKLREGPLRSLMLDELARITRLSRDEVENAAPAAPAAEPMQVREPSPRMRPDSGASRPVKRALQLLLEKPELAEDVPSVELLAQAEAPGLAVLVEALDFFHAHEGARAAQLVSAWRDTPKGAAIQRLLGEEMTLADSAIREEFLDVIALLVDRGINNRVRDFEAQAQLRPLSDQEKAEWRVLAERGKRHKTG